MTGCAAFMPCPMLGIFAAAGYRPRPTTLTLSGWFSVFVEGGGGFGTNCCLPL